MHYCTYITYNVQKFSSFPDNLWSKSCRSCSLYHLWEHASVYPRLVEGGEALHCFKPRDALAACGWQDCPLNCSCDRRTQVVDCGHAGVNVFGPEFQLLFSLNLFYFHISFPTSKGGFILALLYKRTFIDRRSNP